MHFAGFGAEHFPRLVDSTSTPIRKLANPSLGNRETESPIDEVPLSLRVVRMQNANTGDVRRVPDLQNLIRVSCPHRKAVPRFAPCVDAAPKQISSRARSQLAGEAGGVRQARLLLNYG